jgi:spore germination protein PC
MTIYGWNNNYNCNYNYMFDLQQMVAKQNEQIRLLEEKINELEKQMQATSGTSIDRVEYHFDQLKIERLEGTLHIGLSPNELANIDDLGIPTPTPTVQPAVNTPLYDFYHQTLLPNLYGFVNNQGPEIIQRLSKQYNKPIDQRLEGDMIHDMLSQIPDRVAFYDKEAREQLQITDPQQLENYISEQVKKEIYLSLERFMTKSDAEKGES